MTREQLEHAIRAACDITGERVVIVIGSQSILGQFEDAPAALRRSVEVDLVPKSDPANADLIDGALGEFSRFHQAHGFYVHGVTLDAATLPSGWETRVVTVRPDPEREWIGECLQGYDLAASKLAADRHKDKDFVRVLIAEGMLDAGEIAARVRTLPLSISAIERIERWLELTVKELQIQPEAPIRR